MTKFPKEVMLDALDAGVVEDVIYGVSRWAVHHRVVLEIEGRFYQARYSVGATEYQEESPWQDQDEVECQEVHKVIKPMEVWETI